MKHNIRINGQVKEIDCELGSGVLDKNGIEIFEGDIVRYAPLNETFTVVFEAGALNVGDYGLDIGNIEIVGHVTD